MFPLLVKLEKMDLQMEYISDKYNIYRVVSIKRSPSNKRPPNLYSNKTR